MKTLIFIVLVSLAQAALADAAAVIKEAEALNAKARSMENAWTPTAKLIAEAKAAQVEGDEVRASEMGERARMLAEASIRQAELERERWKTRQLVK
ncbi:MAG: hypothetical protein ACPGPD_12260 [Pseudomonadales bacterium]